jgi:D-amino-acid dehydrogenase
MRKGMEKTAIVIGSGIVGLCSALRLSQAGWNVRVIDPRPPGEGCSAGNPGGVSISSILPAASPGVIHKVPGWLLDRDGPLTIRPTYLPFLAPWLIRFIRASAPDRYLHGMRSLYALTQNAAAAWHDLLQSVGQTDVLKRSGHLIVYRDRAQFDIEEKSWQQRRDLGLTVSAVTTDELRQEVPALSADYALGRRVEDNGWLTDPLLVCRMLADQLRARGTEFLTADANDLNIDQAGNPQVKLADEWLSADRVVLAAGAWSAKLAARLGDRIPLQPERGYSITWDEPDLSIPVPVFSPSEKIMAAPTRGGVRFAGTAEFTGFDSPPRWERADSLERLGRRMFPGLTQARTAERWTGLRPSTPDGLPVLSHASRSNRVIYAFGHGHIGVTSAAVTAGVVAELLSGGAASLDCTAYSVGRFR